MAQNVKLDCFTLRIKKHNSDEYLMFDEVFTKKPLHFKNNKGENEILEDCTFYGFFEKYINSFDNRFHTHKSTGKAICLDPNGFHLFRSQRIICGLVEGGSSDIGGKVKHKEKFDDADAFELTPEKIVSVPFYYLLWIPHNSDIGILLVQSFTSKSITEAIKAHLRQFFSKNVPGYSLQIFTRVPDYKIKEMKDEGIIDTIILRRHSLPADRSSNLFGAKYSPFNKVGVDIVFRGVSSIPEVRKAVKDIFSGKRTKIVDIPELAELGFDDDYDILLEFEHNGRKALAKKSKNYDITPAVYVPDSEITRNENNHPTYESMHDYALSYLESIKEEMGYNKATK